MTQPRDLDPIIATWLDDGPIDLPADTRRAIVVGLRTQPRVRRMANLRGLPMNTFSRLATAAGIVLVVGAVSIFALSNRNGGGPGGLSTASPLPSASPAVTAPPSPSVASSPTASPPSTAGWATFTSTRYGYQIKYPPTWTATAATRTWVLATDRLEPPGTGMNGSEDHLEGPYIGGQTGETIALNNFAADLPAGMTEDAWLASYYEGGAFCATMPIFVPITVDGHAGRLDTCFDAQAIVFIGQRVYAFSIWRTDNQPLFTAFLSTVKIQAVSPGPS